MIVDTHVHLIIPGFVKRKFIKGNARMASQIYNRIHKTNITLDQYIGLPAAAEGVYLITVILQFIADSLLRYCSMRSGYYEGLFPVKPLEFPGAN